jgi:replicative superfamily II helicase
MPSFHWTDARAPDAALEVGHLVAHGFAPELVGAWRAAMGAALLPLQAQVLTETGLLRGDNLLVFAPTSSGKTFVAEMAAARHIARGRRAVFLVPTRALAEEQFGRLERTYAPLGWRVAVATRERTAHDAAISAGRFDLAVVVYEKLRAFLAQSPALLPLLGLVAVDELQLLGDRERGALVDLLLTKLLACGHPVQVLGLSAVLGENARLGAWLQSDFFVWRERPVELREGVLCAADGVFRFREVNSGREGVEALLPTPPPAAPDPGDDHHYPAVEALARAFAAEREQTLVFVPTKHLSRAWAFRLGRALGLPPAREAARALEDAEDSHSRELMAQCLAAGVAFHNADLPHDLRRMIEREFDAGHLPVLVATSTLAQGVNLAARNVISVPAMVGCDTLTGAPVLTPLSRQRFRNQGGRAGRYARGQAFGRSILVAATEAEARRLMREYIHGDPEPIEPRADDATAQAMMLDAVAAGIATTAETAGAFVQRTYAHMTAWSAAPQRFDEAMARAVETLAQARLIAVGPGGALRATGLGEAAAAYGLQPGTAALFREFCRCPRAAACSPFEVIAVCAFSPDGHDFPLGLSQREAAAHIFPRMLTARADLDPASMPAPLDRLLAPEGGFAEAEAEALKKTFVAEAWISREPTRDIEQRFQLYAGSIAGLAAHLGWLAQALAACAAALGARDETRTRIARVAARLPEGVEDSGVALAALGVPGLTRMHIAALVREGFDSAEAVAGAGREMMERLLPAPLAARLLESARRALEPPQDAPIPGGALAPQPDKPAAPRETWRELEMSLSNPGQVRFRGREVFLPPLPYQLLVLLARTPGRVVPYREIDEQLWPDAKVEPQQIVFHKAAILRALAGDSAAEPVDDLIRTIRGHGLMLALDPAQVAMRE